eukprot:1031950-Pelagomonas_calceolata.AAC.5
MHFHGKFCRLLSTADMQKMHFHGKFCRLLSTADMPKMHFHGKFCCTFGGSHRCSTTIPTPAPPPHGRSASQPPHHALVMEAWGWAPPAAALQPKHE